MFAWTVSAHAQNAGTVKSSFNKTAGPYGSIAGAFVQPDGKVVFGISKTVVRLNTDGSVDTGFNAPANSGSVATVAASPHGKTVVVIAEDSPSGAYQLLRLQADGTLDPLFSPVTFDADGLSTEARDVTLGIQSDEKILAAGYFTDPATGESVVQMVRYNSDGTQDASFSTPSIANPVYNDIVPLANGKILVAGSAASSSNFLQPVGRIFLLNADGSVDASYQADLGAATDAYAPTLLPDGRIAYLAQLPQMSGGSAITFTGGVPRRLHADGTQDTSFAPQFEAGATFSSLVVQSNGKIVVGGYTTNYAMAPVDNFSQIVTAAGVRRLNTDGTQDTSFSTGTGADQYGSVNITLVTPDSSVLVAGNFGAFDGVPRAQVAELNGDGGLDLPLFNGEATLGNGVYYLSLPDGNPFGYYSFLSNPYYLYHFDLGYEYVFPSTDGDDGVYLYDFKSGGFFYTSSTFPFPYLYDFSLNTVLYYYPDPANPGRYNTNGYRFFYRFDNGQIITK